MNDNMRRAVRTAVQALVAAIATGGLTKVWESYNGLHSVDPTVQLAITLLVLTPLVSWAQNAGEDVLGMGFLLPNDRIVGDVVLGHGIGDLKKTDNLLTDKQATALSSAGH